MSNKKTTKKRLLNLFFIIFLSYALSALLSWNFYDYSFIGLILKQIITVGLFTCFLLFCVYTGWIGFSIYLLVCVFFSALFCTYHAYGYTLSYDLIAATIQTNISEASGMASLGMLISFFTIIIAACGIYILAKKLLFPSKHRVLYTCASLVIFYIFYFTPFLLMECAKTFKKEYNFYMRAASHSMNNDAEVLMSLRHDLFFEQFQHPFSDFVKLRKGLVEYYTPYELNDAASYASTEDEVEQLQFIFVLGESIRADHCSINGYHKPTTPQIEKNPSFFSFTNMRSFGVSTLVSIEGIFSGLLKEESKVNKTSFLSILRKHGYKTSFYAENTRYIFASKKLHELAGKYIDEYETLKGSIDHITAEITKKIALYPGKQIVIIENGTGHFPFLHDPKYSIFQPCNAEYYGAKLQEDRSERTINDYDNCILAIDHMLVQLSEQFKDKMAIVFFCSDHGILLGENNKWIYGTAKDAECRQVASFIWFSPKYEEKYPQRVQAIKAVKDAQLHHGQIYATILMLCGIKTACPLDCDSFDQHRELPQAVE